MLTFAIPLRSKHSSNNWSTVCDAFNRTLRSVCNQTCKEFRVLVAYHDMPEIAKDIDLSKIEFIKVDSPLPNNYKEQMLDKGWKVRTLAVRLHELGGGVLYACRFRRSSIA